MYINSFDLGRK